MRKIYALVALLILGVACNNTAKKQNNDGKLVTTQERAAEDTPTPTTYEEGTRRMERTVAPIGEIGSIEELNYALEHYWDGFDFECGERVSEYDINDICQALIDYTPYVIASRDPHHMATIIDRAEASRPVLDFMWEVCEIVLHDPNSPMRNDELYIPILERLAVSPLLDEYERLIPEHDLKIAQQNRIGTIANDFVYTLADGTTGHLHDIEANYTILMFNNPDCPMCREIIEEIGASPLLNERQEMGRVRIIAVYPDSDLDAWHRYRSQMPRRWIVSYDDGCIIENNDLYNLSAIPSLYLLDSKKHVIIKDGIDVKNIENAIAYMESYN